MTRLTQEEHNVVRFIITSFIHNEINDYNMMFKYINRFCQVNKAQMKKYLKYFQKNDIIFKHEYCDSWFLSDQGNYILNDLIIYYQRRIHRFTKVSNFVSKIKEKNNNKL
jgi:hypothetical protein